MTDRLQKKSRKIIHIDMDCFYVAIELLDKPHLKRKPVAVGGSAQERGVLATCNYVALEYGLHSGMSTALAQKHCPELILLSGQMNHYRAFSQRIHQIFKQYTDHIESLSLDEAYLDVTECKQYRGSATWIAQAVREAIVKQERLTASAGIAPNKLLAKIASEWNKPNGQYVITPDVIATFMLPLAIEKIPGIGRVGAKKLHQMGIRTCGALQQVELNNLIRLFGQWGYTLYERCRGIDERPLEIHHPRKSISVEETFPTDLYDKNSCLAQIPELYARLQHRIKPHYRKKITKLFVKMKFHTFQKTTVECVSHGLNETRYHDLMAIAYDRKKQPVRLLGLGVRLSEQENQTLSLPFF